MSVRGGARPGAGRKPGSKLTRTQELVALATKGGVTPIELLLKDMRFYDNLAEAKWAQLGQNENLSDKDKGKILKVVDTFKARARECAKDAAPYVHPKLNAISAPDGGPIQLSLEVNFVVV